MNMVSKGLLYLTKKSKTVLSPVFSTPEKERLFAECASRSMQSEKTL